MIKTQKNVGAGGHNLTKDIAQIQLALFALGHLSKSDFKKELPVFISDSKLPATISAIKKFQKSVVKLNRPDGRIDVPGRTLRAFPTGIKIKNSVGAGGQNWAKDVEKIQLALVKLGHLSESDFNKESAAFNQDLISPAVSFSKKIKALPIKKNVIADAKLSATISAIKVFQKKIVGARRPDGRVDARGKSFKKIVESLKNINLEETISSTSVPDSFENGSTGTRINTGNNVQQVGKNIIIKNPGNARNDKDKIIDIVKCRSFITNKYNWNGIIKLMKWLYKANKDTYITPTNLKGLPSDDSLIIPDIGIKYLVQAQLSNLLKGKELTSSHFPTKLKGVDGLLGSGTLSFIFNEKSRKKITEKLHDFLNEKSNQAIKNTFSKNVKTFPSPKSKEQTAYNFYRKMVIDANGLWSDNQGVVNVVGLRRAVDDMVTTAYNDTLVTCWKDKTGTPKVEFTVATTEPGDRKQNRQLAPQTMTLVAGFHHNKQPCGRTRHALIRKKRIHEKNRRPEYTFEVDTPMNFHQGGSGFSFPAKVRGNRIIQRGKNKGKKALEAWLWAHGSSGFKMRSGYTNSRFNEIQLFEFHRTFAEVVAILSKYGKDKSVAPYQNLKNLAESNPMTIKVGEIKKEGSNEKVPGITITQNGKKKTVDIHKMKEWVVNYWYSKRLLKENRLKIFAIIKELSTFSAKGVEKLMTLSDQEILPQIRDKFIVDIVKLQSEHYPNLSDIDAKAGLDFFNIIEGVRQTRKEAKVDFAKMKKLMTRLESLPIKNFATFKKNIETSFKINSDKGRLSIKNNKVFNKTINADVIEHVKVRGWSEGCQVTYDHETFFGFWSDLLERGQKSKQRRWYYTLVNVIEAKD